MRPPPTFATGSFFLLAQGLARRSRPGPEPQCLDGHSAPPSAALAVAKEGFRRRRRWLRSSTATKVAHAGLNQVNDLAVAGRDNEASKSNNRRKDARRRRLAMIE